MSETTLKIKEKRGSELMINFLDHGLVIFNSDAISCQFPTTTLVPILDWMNNALKLLDRTNGMQGLTLFIDPADMDRLMEFMLDNMPLLQREAYYEDRNQTLQMKKLQEA